jgi:hypothetical protein
VPIARAAYQSKRKGMDIRRNTPSLNSNSAAALAGLLRMVVAQAAEVAPEQVPASYFHYFLSQVH